MLVTNGSQMTRKETPQRIAQRQKWHEENPLLRVPKPLIEEFRQRILEYRGVRPLTGNVKNNTHEEKAIA